MADSLVFITGASSGLGAALAATVPYDDAHVVDISRSGGTPRTEHLPADLADPASWSTVAAHLLARLAAFAGQRVIFIHNAGTLDPIGFAGEVDTTAYRANVLLNSASGQVLGHAFLAAVAEAHFDGEVVVVLVSSGAARNPYPGWSAYSAGKAAGDQWVRAVAQEQAERGTRARVLAIAPGVVATAMQEKIRQTDPTQFPAVERFHQLQADGALRDPADAATALWAVISGDTESGTVLDLRSGRR